MFSKFQNWRKNCALDDDRGRQQVSRSCVWDQGVKVVVGECKPTPQQITPAGRLRWSLSAIVPGMVPKRLHRIHEDTGEGLLDKLGNMREMLVSIERSLERMQPIKPRQQRKKKAQKRPALVAVPPPQNGLRSNPWFTLSCSAGDLQK